MSQSLPAHVSAKRSGNGAERAENAVIGKRRSGEQVSQKIGLSADRQIGRSQQRSHVSDSDLLVRERPPMMQLD